MWRPEINFKWRSISINKLGVNLVLSFSKKFKRFLTLQIKFFRLFSFISHSTPTYTSHINAVENCSFNNKSKRAFISNWVKCAIFMSFFLNINFSRRDIVLLQVLCKNKEFSINKRPQNQYLRFVCHFLWVSELKSEIERENIDRKIRERKFNEKTSRDFSRLTERDSSRGNDEHESVRGKQNWICVYVSLFVTCREQKDLFKSHFGCIQKDFSSWRWHQEMELFNLSLKLI